MQGNENAADLRTCHRCQRELPFSEFHRESRNSTGLQRWCRTCANSWRREYYRATPERRRRSNVTKAVYYARNRERLIRRNRKTEILRKYGLSWEEHERILAAQGGVCALCGASEPRGKGWWHVDHDHATKRVRGLLCHLCNTQLGVYQKFPKKVGPARLATYLEIQEIGDAVDSKRRTGETYQKGEYAQKTPAMGEGRELGT